MTDSLNPRSTRILKRRFLTQPSSVVASFVLEEYKGNTLSKDNLPGHPKIISLFYSAKLTAQEKSYL